MFTGALTVTASSAFFSYLLALTIELRIKLKNSTVVSYKKRNCYYHVYTCCVSVSFGVVGVLTGQFGVSDVSTCSFEDGKPGRYVYSSFIFVNIFVIWFILISIWKELKNSVSSLMFNYVMVIVSVSLTICVAQIMELLEHLSQHKGTYKMIGIIFGSLTGTCIALARLCNRSLMTRLYIRMFRGPNRPLTDTMLSMISMDEITNEEVTFLGEFFEIITKKVNFIQTIYQILAMMYLKFEELGSENNIITGNIRFTDYKFQEEFIEKILNPKLGKIKSQKGKSYSEGLKNKILREYMPLEFKKIRDLCGISSKELQW